MSRLWLREWLLPVRGRAESGMVICFRLSRRDPPAEEGCSSSSNGGMEGAASASSASSTPSGRGSRGRDAGCFPARKKEAGRKVSEMLKRGCLGGIKISNSAPAASAASEAPPSGIWMQRGGLAAWVDWALLPILWLSAGSSASAFPPWAGAWASGGASMASGTSM